MWLPESTCHGYKPKARINKFNDCEIITQQSRFSNGVQKRNVIHQAVNLMTPLNIYGLIAYSDMTALSYEHTNISLILGSLAAFRGATPLSQALTPSTRLDLYT